MSVLIDLGVLWYPDVAWAWGKVNVVGGLTPARWLEYERDGTRTGGLGAKPIGYFCRTNGTRTVYSDDMHFVDWFDSQMPAGRPAGNCPVAISPNGRVFYQVGVGGTFVVYEHVRGELPRRVCEGRPTGIWDAFDDGTVLLWDDCFMGGTTHVREGIIAWERKDNDGVCIVIDNIKRHLCRDKGAFWPRLAVDGENVAVVWCDQFKGNQGWLWMGTKAELRALPLVPETPAPPVPPTPDPEPPKPEGEPMRLTASEKATLIAFNEKFPVAAIPGADEEARRAWTWKLAQTFAARFVIGWGTKRADANRPLSKDSIAYVSAGRLYGFDVVLGTDPLTLNENVDGEDITGQVYVPVPAKDWLADTPVPPVEPPVEPPGPAPTDLEKRVADLEDIVAGISAFLDDTFKEFGE